jgi:mannosyltransferase
MQLSRTDKYTLVALVALNAVLKLCWLGVNELSGDEPFTVFWAQQSTRDLMDMFRDENNPPLHFFLMKWWSARTPFEVPWLRVPSALFSALAVWPLFLLARRHVGAWGAVATCLLFSFCNEHYTYAHEVRAYSLLTLLTITGMWQLDRMVRKEPRALLWLVLLNTALAYTHFMGWAAIGIQLLCTLVVREWRPAHRGWFKATMVAVVLFIPYGWLFVQRVGASVSQGTWLTAPAWDEPYSILWRWSNAPVITVAFLCVIAYAFLRVRLKNSAMRIGLVWAGVPLVGLFLVSFVVPLYLDRYLVWAAPGFALLVAASLSVIAENSKVIGGSLAVACAAMLVTFTPWKGNGVKPSRVVAQVNKWHNDKNGGLVAVLPYWYFLTCAAAVEIDELRDPNALNMWREGEARGQGSIGGFSAQDSVIVLVDADPDHSHATNTRTWLSTNYSPVDSVEADKKVWVYRFRK